jgi:phosphohistidine swiveling domain-containing protein
MSKAAENRSGVLQWVVVLGVGALVIALILSLQLIPRLSDGQKVLNGAKPAFSTQRLNADVAGVNFISTDVDMADPIMTAQGGAAAEVPKLVAFVSSKTGLTQAQVVAALQKNFPHVLGLLEALPLSSVSGELPGLEKFLESALHVTPAQLTAALKQNFPALTQAITNLPTVTSGWNQIPGIDPLTRYDGTPVHSVPQLRDYFKDDLIPGVGAQQSNFESLDGTSSLNWIAVVLLIIAGIVVMFALAMIVRNLRATPGRRESIAAASVVPVVGVVVVALVLALALIPRVHHGQKLLDGLKPANTAQRVHGDRVGINMVGTIIATEDPIMTAQGGAAGEVPKLVTFVSSKTGLTQAQVVAALQKNFPHVLGLLEALPLSSVSGELPGLDKFLESALHATPAQLTAALKQNFPALTQAITNLPTVTSGWNKLPNMAGATNFAGRPITTAPQLGAYLSGDVVPVFETQRANYDTLTSISRIDFIGWLVLAIGIIVILYGALMVVLAAGWLRGRGDPGVAVDGSAMTPAPAPS